MVGGSDALLSPAMERAEPRSECVMSVFTPAEIAYLETQRLGRLATVGPNGQPHVVPVTFRYNPEQDAIDIGGRHFAQSKKFRDVQANGRVAFVIDDGDAPRRFRGIEIRGEAEIHETGGDQILPFFDPEFVRISPRRIVSWGLEDGYRARSVPARTTA